MAALELFVLGTPRLARDGQPVGLNLRRALALLTYLAVVRRPHSREALAALLWPDADERDGRARLRRTLHRLTEVVGSERLQADGDLVCLADTTTLWVDHHAFERHAAAGLADGRALSTPQLRSIADLEAAAGLYRDDFLAGFSLPDSPAWEEWQFLERERLRQTCARVLEQLARVQGAVGNWEAAIGYARHWLALDQLHEPAQRALIEAYARAGQQAAALRQYRACARLLDAELGVEPEAETTRLYEAIRSRRVGPAPSARCATEPPTDQVDRSARDHTGPVAAQPAAERMVGRDRELAELEGHLARALAGQQQIIFISGDAGLGKTSLVEAFLRVARQRAPMLVAHGQCLEHRGAGEPYMPVLEAIGRLCRGPEGSELVALLEARAPTWLIQLPWLIDPSRLESVQLRVLGATRERMLREMVEAIEILTADRPLILVLEDLHWVDYSTLDLIDRLARRHEPARLLLLGTYRPADAQTTDHPLHRLARELCLRGHAAELRVTLLSEPAVNEYLQRRFPNLGLPPGLSSLLHDRTDGNPLFMASVVESWVAKGLLEERDGRLIPGRGLAALGQDVPDSLRQLIEQQLERIDTADQELLEIASVSGMVFSAATIAAAAEIEDEAAEARCAILARRGLFIRSDGIAEWPDGAVAAQFTFRHYLYQHVLYDRVPPGRRARLHRQIGSRLEAAYGTRVREISAELAVHFVRGRAPHRAVRCLQLAAEQALQRSAHREAVAHMLAGLKALEEWADSPERLHQELLLQSALAPALAAIEGWGSKRAEEAYLRARELSEMLEDAALRYKVLFGLAALHEYRGEYTTTQALMEQRIDGVAHDGPDDYLLESYDLLACSLFHQGKFDGALSQAEHGLRLYDPTRQHALIAAFGEDPGVQHHGWASLSLWFLGYPDQAIDRANQAIELARSHLYSLAGAMVRSAGVYQLRREPEPTERLAAEGVRLAEEQGFPYWASFGRVLRGWAVAADGRFDDGILELRAGLEACRSTGALIDHPYLLALLADACHLAGRLDEGLTAVSDALALVESSRGFYFEAELHRLHGELLLQAGARGGAELAEASFLTSIAVARHQRSRSLELRTCLSLGRLWRSLGRSGEALATLVEARAWFTEGLDTPDRRAADTLIEQLRREAGGAVVGRASGR